MQFSAETKMLQRSGGFPLSTVIKSYSCFEKLNQCNYLYFTLRHLFYFLNHVEAA